MRRVLLLLVVVGLAGCWGTPTEGPRIDARGNTGTVITNITSGSSSPVGTAPCGANSSQKTGENQPAAPNCSTNNTAEPFVVPVSGAS